MVPASVPTAPPILTPYAQLLIRQKARQIIRKSGFGASDHDDLIQELTLRLLEKAHLYDPTRGATLETFADRVINSGVRMILREQRCPKRTPKKKAVSLERTIVTADDKYSTLSDVISNDDLDRRTLGESSTSPVTDTSTVSEALGALPADLADVAARLMHGTVTSVARDLGVTRRQVHRAIQRIRAQWGRTEITI